MFRYINISLFALALAGVANAGAIDPAITSDFSSPDGALFSGAACGGTYCTTVGTFVGAPPTNATYPTGNNFYQGNIASYNAASSATSSVNCTYANVFGSNPGGGCEGAATDLLFADQAPGATYTIDFTLNAPKTIYGFEIWLSDDSPASNGRGITNVKFYNGSASGSLITNDTIVTSGSYTSNFTSNKITLTDTFFAGVTGTEFTFTFTGAANGPRIRTIESIDAPAVPEPGTWMLAGFGMLGLVAATKMRNRRLHAKL